MQFIRWCHFRAVRNEILGQRFSGLLAPAGRDALDAALSAGAAWTGVLAATMPDGRTALVHIQVEPLACLDVPGQVAVTVTPVVPARHQLLSQAGLRLGSTLDLGGIAQQVVDVTAAGFADVAEIYVLERLLAGGELTGPQGAGPLAVTPGNQVIAAGQVAGQADQQREEREERGPARHGAAVPRGG